MDTVNVLANLTEEEAIAIYKQGQEAVVFKLLELAKAVQERNLLISKLTNGKNPTALSTPSGAIPVYEKENHPGRGRKKPGRKKGHKGECREKPDRIDNKIELPLPRCPDCGDEVQKAPVTRKRYIEDIPESAPVVTEVTIPRGFCKRCNKWVEPVVTTALPNSNIGLNLLALSAWLHYGLGNTISHIIEVLNFHLQFSLSKGGLVQMWRRLSVILSTWYDKIVQEARSSAYLHADETGWRVNGITNWLWCFTNERLTCFMIDRSRGSPALKKFFGDIFEGVLITDFWRAYDKISRYRQACFVHFFREIAAITEKNQSDEWLAFRKKLVRWMRDALRLDEREGMAEEKKVACKERLYKRLSEFTGTEFRDKDCIRIRKRLKSHEDSLLTFLDYEGVPADNNKAEREIRPSVIMRKNSLHNKSEKGAYTQAVLMSIYRTLKIRGHNPISTIVHALSHFIEKGELPDLPEPILQKAK